MIVRDRPGLLKLFFILRGSVIQRIFPQVLFVFALSAGVVWSHQAFPVMVPSVNSGPFALLGIALSVFLGFRNNACYDRWWEARKDWGQLIFVSRDFARQTLILEAGGAEGARARLLNLVITFAQTLVCHLRPGSKPDKALRRLPADLLPAYKASRNAPDLLLREIGTLLAGLRAADRVSDIQYMMLDSTVGRMSAVLAACERTRNTPVPFGCAAAIKVRFSVNQDETRRRGCDEGRA